jgi:sterol desaturase/sphingolipid hydroxylase (fatty acid hydroxylase superfamily)
VLLSGCLIVGSRQPTTGQSDPTYSDPIIPEFLTQALASTWVTLKLVMSAYAIGLAVERFWPAQVRQPWSHILFNLVYTVPFLFLTHLLLPPLSALTAPWIAAHGGIFPIELPASTGWQIVQGLLFVLTFDFFYYWMHRAQHYFPWFWSLHKLHHADPSVNVTSNQRHHFLEEPIRAFLVLLPLGILFSIKPPNITSVWLVLGLWGFAIHANVRLPFGPLTPVVAGPQLHRLHHSVLPQHTDVNFAAFFPVWDILFGTYVAPKRNEWPETGTHAGDDLNRLDRALFSPFADWMRRPSEPAVAAKRVDCAGRPADNQPDC